MRQGAVYVTSPLQEEQVEMHVLLPSQSDGYPAQKVGQKESSRRTQAVGALFRINDLQDIT